MVRRSLLFGINGKEDLDKLEEGGVISRREQERLEHVFDEKGSFVYVATKWTDEGYEGGTVISFEDLCLLVGDIL